MSQRCWERQLRYYGDFPIDNNMVGKWKEVKNAMGRRFEMKQVVLKDDESITVDTGIFTVHIRKIYDGTAAYVRVDSREVDGVELKLREQNPEVIILDGAK